MPWTQLGDSCRNAAKSCMDMYQATQAEMFEVCARGLEAVCAHLDRYRSGVVMTADFLKELGETAKGVCGETCSDVQAASFALVELMALVMRETSLRAGTVPTQAEAALLRYFEESGNWDPHDSTLVSDYYYRKIPMALLPSFSGEKTMSGHA